jgi:putative thioredoxin
MLLKGGQPVDGFMGALPAGQVRSSWTSTCPARGLVAGPGHEDRAAQAGGPCWPRANGDALAHDRANDDARFDYVRRWRTGGLEPRHAAASR